ncbi:Ubiquitin carboxyl-terminal hydrolase 5-like protein [Drosera capensis]
MVETGEIDRLLVEENRWYNFDDSHISHMNEDEVKSPAAYVLFYRRAYSHFLFGKDRKLNRFCSFKLVFVEAVAVDLGHAGLPGEEPLMQDSSLLFR